MSRRWRLRILPTPGIRRIVLALCGVGLLGLALPTLLAQGERQSTKTLPSDHQERIRVQLVEVKLRVTDKQGRPITDVKPEEVTVLQGGREQRLAYFESLASRAISAPVPTPLYEADGSAVAPEPTAVASPRPTRRIVLAFDPRNSRFPIREDWREAAIEWVRESMKPEDVVSMVVLRSYPDWIVPPTGDRQKLLEGLETIDLYTDIPNRNRRDEMTSFLDELRTLCVETGGRRRAGRQGNEAPSQSINDLGSREVSCAYDMARPRVHDWNVQTEESFEGLRSLAGELAAVPGQKTVILFSEGMIDDPSIVAVNAMLSVFGTSKIDMAMMTTRLQGLSLRHLSELYHITAAADVAFFTLDTRSANDGNNFFNIEENSLAIQNNSGAFNPYGDMYDATRSTLAGLAYATGGKPFYGQDGLDWKIQAAADSFFGIYVVGYYRSAETSPRAKVKIKIDRKKLLVKYDDKPLRAVHQPLSTQLDLAVGQPVQTGNGDKQTLPVALIVPVETLPLRKGAGGYGCELGVFVQAVRPDGTIADEVFDTTALVLTKKERENTRGRNFRHVVELELPPGPVRLRARLSDDRQEVIGDRSIDFTLVIGGVRAGIVENP